MSERRLSTNRVLIVLLVAAVIVVIMLAVLFWRVRQIAQATPEPSPEAASPSETPAPIDLPTRTPFPLDALNLQDPKGVSNLYIEYILDASGSMLELLSDGVAKRDAAKEYLIEHLLTFAPETHFGLSAYGHRVRWEDDREESCKDIELVAPVEVGQLTAVSGWLQEFETLGMTPIHASVERALHDFDTSDPDRLNNIILISDGIETCAGNPCELVELARKAGVNFSVHVVGLAVDAETRAQLSCIADEGGGVYYDVYTAADLRAALEAIGEDVRAEERIVSYAEATETARPVTPTPTATATPTPTPEPTATLTPTPEPTATPTPARVLPEAISYSFRITASDRGIYGGFGEEWRAHFDRDWRRDTVCREAAGQPGPLVEVVCQETYSGNYYDSWVPDTFTHVWDVVAGELTDVVADDVQPSGHEVGSTTITVLGRETIVTIREAAWEDDPVVDAQGNTWQEFWWCTTYYAENDMFVVDKCHMDYYLFMDGQSILASSRDSELEMLEANLDFWGE